MKRQSMRRRNAGRAKKVKARNFGPEAEAVRAMPCLCFAVAHHKMRLAARPQPVALDMGSCSKTGVQAAHVTARGMGGARGGRFDLVPLCAAHHAEAGEARTSQRRAFGERYGLDLRDEADRIALAHEPPLGVRGLALRWADTAGRPEGVVVDTAEAARVYAERLGRSPQSLTKGERMEAIQMAAMAGAASWRPPAGEPLTPYELDALLGWVRRRVSRARAAADQAIGGGVEAQARGLFVALQDLLARVLEVANDLGVDAAVAVALCKAAEVEP